MARQAYQNNSSKYFINNFLSSYTAVTTLLKGRGIDLDHKRFLILQGEVESISQMKAKAQNEHEDGLLEYLEDIIGTSAYKETIEKSAVELEALNDERSERLTRVKYVEKERESLEVRSLHCYLDTSRLTQGGVTDCLRSDANSLYFFISGHVHLGTKTRGGGILEKRKQYGYQTVCFVSDLSVGVQQKVGQGGEASGKPDTNPARSLL